MQQGLLGQHLSYLLSEGGNMATGIVRECLLTPALKSLLCISLSHTVMDEWV